jgi:hypothetical protein
MLKAQGIAKLHNYYFHNAQYFTFTISYQPLQELLIPNDNLAKPEITPLRILCFSI